MVQVGNWHKMVGNYLSPRQSECSRKRL